MNIYNDEQFSRLFSMLNALYFDSSDFFVWRAVVARKEHEDEFGVVVKNGETYYKRQYGNAFDGVDKLSRQSMERLIFLLFNGNFHLQKWCETILKEKERLYKESLAKLPSPLDMIMKGETL